MWPTITGLRVLKGAEAELVRAAAAVVTQHVVAERAGQGEPRRYGIDWFDQWDADQRIWMLEQVALALLTLHTPPSPAAIWEATIDAIFCEVIELIEAEIDSETLTTTEPSWRQRVVAAFQSQNEKLPRIEVDEIDIKLWRRVVTQIADAILGVTSYQKAESFRDGDVQQLRRFLTQKGLPDNFLQRIPPLPSREQTERSLSRLQSVLDA